MSTLNNNKDIIVFLVLMILFRSSFADINNVPTGSMQPTIVEGDRIIVNKLAYDLKLPLIGTKIMRLAEPERGDIVIFESTVSKQRLVKRIIGLPGEKISMFNNRLSINGQVLKYTTLNEPALRTKEHIDLFENLAHNDHKVRVSINGSTKDTFNEALVPSGHYLVLGDNRDNSADSRYIGFVPRSEIIGRSSRLLMSLDSENFYLPRSDRFLKVL